MGLTHMSSVPLRPTAVEETLSGHSLSGENIAQAAEHAAQGTDPPGDLDATPELQAPSGPCADAPRAAGGEYQGVNAARASRVT